MGTKAVQLMEWLATFLSDLISGSLAGILGGAIGGTMGGVAVLAVQNWLRHKGTIEAAHKQGASRVQYLQSGTPSTQKSLADEIHYAFTLHLFNSKPSNSGIRALEVVFYSGNRLELRHKPNNRDKPEYSPGSNVPVGYEEIDLLDLPSGQWVTLRFLGELKGNDAVKARECDHVQLQGYLFAGDEWTFRLNWE